MIFHIFIYFQNYISFLMRLSRTLKKSNESIWLKKIRFNRKNLIYSKQILTLYSFIIIMMKIAIVTESIYYHTNFGVDCANIGPRESMQYINYMQQIT